MTAEKEHADRSGLEERVIETLTDLREERGWSQSELARKMADAGWPKYTQMTVSRTEKGDRPIRLDEADALAKVFEVDISFLWMPRIDRLYIDSLKHVERLAVELEDLIGRYLHARSVLAVRADMLDIHEDEFSYAAATLMATPETIAARVRADLASRRERAKEITHESHRSERDLEIEARFWELPDGDRKLQKLLGELNG